MLKKFIAAIGLARAYPAVTTLIWAVGRDLSQFRIDHKNSIYLRLLYLQIVFI